MKRDTCCQQGKAKCRPGERCSGLCLGCGCTALCSSKTRSTHFAPAFVQLLEGGLAVAVTAAASDGHKNQQVFLADCWGVTGLRYLAPFRNLIFVALTDSLHTCGILGQACVLHLGQSHTPLQWMWRGATCNRMHGACTLYKCKSVFRGLESETPGLLTAKHRPHHLLTAFFPGLNIFVYVVCDYLHHCSFSPTSVLPPHSPARSCHLQRTQRPQTSKTY